MATQLTTVNTGTAVSAHPAAERMPAPAKARGITPESWHVMKTVLFKGASDEMICTLVDYCKARKLDPLKKPFHIVNVWDSDAGRVTESIWPSIGELRTTAMRTGEYAGKGEIVFGPDVTQRLDKQEFTFPEWAQCTVYRIVKGQRVEFAGSRVYWLETFASKKGGAPNSMWAKRSRGQIAKCAEAEALRSAFPEETGSVPTAEEMEGQTIGSEAMRDVTPSAAAIARGAPPPPEDVLICDQYGEEYSLSVDEAAASLVRWCNEATDEELTALVENNDPAVVGDVVDIERMRRQAKAKAEAEEPMLKIVKILKADGAALYTGSIFREAIVAYGKVKESAPDKALIAVKNLPALKVLKDHAEGKTFERLIQEIEAAEAAASQYDDQPALV